MKKLILSILFLVTLASRADFVVVENTGNPRTDILAAAAIAAPDDTLIMYEVTANITSPIVITKPLKLWGAGTMEEWEAGVFRTVLTDKIPSTGGAGIFKFSGVVGPINPIEITGFNLKAGIAGKPNSALITVAYSKQFRIHHNKFDLGTWAAQAIWTYSAGLIDHNDFTTTSNGSQRGITVMGSGNSPWMDNFDTILANELKWVRIEDNNFLFKGEGDGAVDCFNGGRYYFRYNYVENTNFAASGHGFDSGDFRGMFGSVCYGNTWRINITSGYATSGGQSRSGTHHVFNNVGTKSASQTTYGITRICVYRTSQTSLIASCCGTHGVVTGHNGYDENTTAKGRRARDQIGTTGPTTGPDYSTTGPSPAALPSSTQGTAMSYFYGNTMNGVTINATIDSNSDNTSGNPKVRDIVWEGVDFTNAAPSVSITYAAYPDTYQAFGRQSEDPNAPPSISSIADQTIDQDEDTGNIAFTIADEETPAADLDLTVGSSDETLIPEEGIEITGSGGSRFVKVTPTAGRSGSSIITITVADEDLATASESFLVTVNSTESNTAPTLSSTEDIVIPAYTNLWTTEVTVGDAEQSAGTLVTQSFSSNTGVIPNESLHWNGDGAIRLLSLDLDPSLWITGTTTITNVVSDGLLTTFDTFDVTIGKPPTIPSNTRLKGAINIKIAR